MSRLITTIKRWVSHQILLGYSAIFHWLYTTFAWAYDLVAGVVSLGRWKKWVLEALPPTVSCPVLELGFGPGHLLEALSLKNMDVYGIDLSKQMCSLAQKRLQKSGYDAKIYRASSDAIPFASQSFSTIVSTFPAPFIFTDTTAEEIYRVLSSEGIFVVLLSVHMNGSSLPERFMRSVFRWAEPQQIDQDNVEALFSAYLRVGLIPSLEVLPIGNDEMLLIKIIKSQLSNSLNLR